jgi:endogenous inhibitor of DNA gyrase (YacG/DUF329 family)
VSVALCVFCRQHAVDPRWRPFCSERCKMLDVLNGQSRRGRVKFFDVRPAVQDVHAPRFAGQASSASRSKWVDGDYRIPVETIEEPADDDEDPDL